MREIWADIEGYEGLYKVSNLGNVSGKKMLTPSKSSSGYYKVELYKDKISKVFWIHRLVAQTFLPNPDNKPQVNHKDGNKLNNILSNLEWVTVSENQIHAINSGLRLPSPMIGKIGKLNPNSIKVLQYDAYGNFIRVWDCLADIGRYYNCSTNPISSCINGRTHSSYGYIWKPYTEGFPKTIESLQSIYRKNAPLKKGIHKRKIKVNQFTKSGELIRCWSSLDEIYNNTEYKINSILRCINGSRKTAYGFIWIIADN